MIRAEVRVLTPQLHPSLGPSADPQAQIKLGPGRQKSFWEELILVRPLITVLLRQLLTIPDLVFATINSTNDRDYSTTALL